MKKLNIFKLAFLLLAAAMTMQSCSDSNDGTASSPVLEVYKDSVAIDNIAFPLAAKSSIIGVKCNEDWTAELSDTSWVRLSNHAGYGNDKNFTYTKIQVLKNDLESKRTAILTIRGKSLTKVVTIVQNGKEKDPNDPFETSFELLEHLRIGYNLGNTLDSNPTGSYWDPVGKTPKEWEQSWGQPETTQEIIDTLALKGFNVIRVPVTWAPHMDADGNVDTAWMDRVEEVVNYVLNAGCYCILNVQHDTGSDASAWVVADMSKYATVSPRFKSLWTQIANRFKNYNEKLVFEAFNEILTSNAEWGDPADVTAYEAVNKLEQDFVDAVRATGGNNEYRNLIVNPYSAGNTDAKLAGVQIPDDMHPNHIMASVHTYDPYWFCNDSSNPDEQNYYINIFDEAQQQVIADIVSRVTKRYDDLGVPVLFGEFGAIGTHPDMSERVKYAKYALQQFRSHGTTGLWWMGLLNRRRLRWYEADIVNALMETAQ